MAAICRYSRAFLHSFQRETAKNHSRISQLFQTNKHVLVSRLLALTHRHTVFKTQFLISLLEVIRTPWEMLRGRCLKLFLILAN